MTFKNLSFNALTVGKVAERAVNMTAEVIVPFLTNKIEIPKGAELQLQLDEVKQQPKPTKRTWKDSVAEERRTAEKAPTAARIGESPGADVDI